MIQNQVKPHRAHAQGASQKVPLQITQQGSVIRSRDESSSRQGQERSKTKTFFTPHAIRSLLSSFIGGLGACPQSAAGTPAPHERLRRLGASPQTHRKKAKIKQTSRKHNIKEDWPFE